MVVHEDEYKVNKKLKRFPKIHELLKYDEATNTYEVIWNDRNIQAITNIVKTVVNKHFMNPEMYEEYISHALTKVVDVLISGEFNYRDYGTTAGLKNFLYTCARNSLTDYTYHFKNSKKEVFYDSIPESIERDSFLPSLSEHEIDKYLKYYFNKFYLVPQTFDKSEFVFLVKALGYEVDAPFSKPKEENIYALEKCLSLFSKYYFNKML